MQEGSIAYLLTLIGFTYEQGIAAALLIRVITTVVSLLGGLWLLIAGKELWQMVQSGQKNKLVQEMESDEEGNGE